MKALSPGAQLPANRGPYNDDLEFKDAPANPVSKYSKHVPLTANAKFYSRQHDDIKCRTTVKSQFEAKKILNTENEMKGCTFTPQMTTKNSKKRSLNAFMEEQS